MLAWWIEELWNSPSGNGKVLTISWVYWVIFSIVLHELAHGWAAILCGDRTPIESGHMTWNPLVHMGPASLMLFAIAGIAWGLMPVNPSRFRRRYDDALVSLAGPAMNFLLATLCIVLYGVWVAAAGGYWFSGVSVNDVLFKNTQIFLRLGIMLNIALGIFNLLPVPPLDGSRIAANIVPAYRRALESPQAPYIALGLFAFMFLYAGEPVFDAAMKVTHRATDLIGRVLLPSWAHSPTP